MFVCGMVLLGLGALGCAQTAWQTPPAAEASADRPILTSCCVRPAGAAAHSSIVQSPNGLRFQSCGCGKGPRWEPSS